MPGHDTAVKSLFCQYIDRLLQHWQKRFSKGCATAVTMQAPLAVQVSANGTHIDCFTEAMVDLSDLTLDVMTYRVIKRLTTLKQR